MDTTAFGPDAPGKLVPIELNKRVVRAGVPRLEPIASLAFVPSPLPPTLNWNEIKVMLFDLHSEALLALGRLNGLHKRLSNASTLLRTLWMREARQSTAVENIHTTSQEMVEAGANRDTPARHNAREAWNYVRALEHGLASTLPVVTRLVREMHAILLEGVDGEDKRPGQLRNIPVYIQGDEPGPEHARFVPPPPGQVLDECLREFEVFANTPQAGIPPLIGVALMHYQFETIHPFADGNGRLGRVLMSLSLVRSGLLDHPVVYFSQFIRLNKQRYVDSLLAVSTRGNWTAWIRFILEAILQQSIDAIARSEHLIDLRDRYLAAIKEHDLPSRLTRVVDRLFELPVINAEEARSILDVERPTVYADIKTLERLGVIEESTGKKRGRDWVAREILEIIGSERTDGSPTSS